MAVKFKGIGRLMSWRRAQREEHTGDPGRTNPAQDCIAGTAPTYPPAARESGRRGHELGVRVPPDLVRILRTE